MLSIRNILFLAASVTALPSFLTARDAGAILKDLQGIDDSVKKMAGTVKDWDGKLTSALEIKAQANDVKDQLSSAADATKSEKQQSTDDSKKILDFVTKTLTPDITANMKALEGRKKDFESVGLTATVHDTLADLQKNKLTGNLVKVASKDTHGDAEKAADGVNAAFTDALNAFPAS